jgi:hypothetical protein
MHELKYRRQARNYLARLPIKIKSKIVDDSCIIINNAQKKIGGIVLPVWIYQEEFLID